MEKEKILNYFLERSVQLDKDALEILSTSPYILEKIKKIPDSKLPIVITSGWIRDVETGIKILKKPNFPTLLSMTDFLNMYRRRYETLKSILVDKNLPNLVSVNKINNKMKTFSLIGTIIQKESETIYIEDNTGVFSLVCKDVNLLDEGDVIGVVCERKGDLHYIKEIIFPDIELNKIIKKSQNEEKALFISDIHMDSPNFNQHFYKNFIKWISEQEKLNIFVIGKISDNEADVKEIFQLFKNHSVFILEDIIKSSDENINKYTNPIFLEYNGIKFFLFYGNFLKPYMQRLSLPIDKTMIHLVKKRNLNPSSNLLENDAYFLDVVPDIIAFGGVEIPFCINYKGITIVSGGNFLQKPIFWLINLKTRETFKLDFS